MKKLFVLALAAATLSLGSCKKDKSLSEVMTSGTWTITYLMADADGNGTPETDLMALMEACSMDDYTQFNANGTAIASEGTDVCAGNDPETTATWSVSADETTMTFTETGGDPETYTVQSFSDNEIKLTIDNALFGTLYITFTKN